MVKQGYKQTEIGVIPEDWEVVKIGDNFNFKNGLNKEKKYFGYGFPIVNYMDVFKNTFINSKTIKGKVFVNKQELKNFNVNEGDVLFTRTSETQEEIGYSAVVVEELKDTVFSGFVLRGRPLNDLFSIQFCRYVFSNKVVREQIISNASFTTRALTNGRVLSEVKIPLPPLPEQEAIAEALSDADAWIESLEQLIAKKRLIKQGAMQELLTPKEDWEAKKLGEVCDFKNGKSLESKISDTGVFNIISLNSIDIRGKLKKDHHKTNFNDNSLKKGDIVMVLSDVAHGNFLGLCDIIPDDNYVLNQRMGGLFNFRNIHVPFLRLQINYNQKYFKFSGKGSSQLNLGKPDILNFDLHFPSLSEQTRIATILSDMDAELEALEQKLSKARQIKQGMMQELLTGKTRLIDN